MSPRDSNWTDVLTIFVLFFGISLLDALSSTHWWGAVFWLLMAIAFAFLASRRRASRRASR